MTSPKIRTSARQAAARQRIQQIDDPSGSAPPFEPTPAFPGWIINPGRHEERHLIESMMLHLQDDPFHTMDANVLRFAFKEWPMLMHSMNTKATIKNVKRQLLQLKVLYISRATDNDWAFLADYTLDGTKDPPLLPGCFRPFDTPGPSSCNNASRYPSNATPIAIPRS